MLNPMISDIFSQWRCRRPGLQRMWTTGRCSWGRGGGEEGREGGRGGRGGREGGRGGGR